MVVNAAPSESIALGQIDIQDIFVRYDRAVALNGVSFLVVPGEWLGIIGANGAGKSTLLRSVARLVTYEGSVRVDGRDTESMSRRELARLVAYVPQNPDFPAQMRAIDYVALGRTPHHGYFGAESAYDRDHSAALLERLDMSHLALRHLDAMSGGELQRLVLARALAQEAPILLLDEPTSALDLGRRVEALELVDELRLERRLTVVSTLHDLTLAAQFAKRVLLLSDGCAVADGSPETVLVEESLNRFFDVKVEILRSEENDIVVIPRRSRKKDVHD
jgi:iron complex transport system ATP-binding protein